MPPAGSAASPSQPEAHAAGVLHGGDPAFELALGLGVDHRADMGRRLARVADFQFAHGADQHVEHRLGHLLLQAKKPQRRAALAGGAERGRDHVVDHLLGQRRGIDDHGVDAAGLGDQRYDRSALLRQRAVDRLADLGRAGEGDTGDVAIGDEEGADLAVAGNEMKRARRHAGVVQERDGARGDERRLLGRLGDDRVAGGERAGHLAEEDRQRKIPRADADEDAATAIAQQIAFAGRARHRLRRQRRARLRRVIAAIIDGLAQLGERIVERLAALVLQQCEQRAAFLLEPIGGAFERCGALGRGRRRPGREPGRGRRHRRVRDRRVALAHHSDRTAVDRRDDPCARSRRAPRRR